MTVQELIDELNKFEDKNRIVIVYMGYINKWYDYVEGAEEYCTMYGEDAVSITLKND